VELQITHNINGPGVVVEKLQVRSYSYDEYAVVVGLSRSH